MANYTIIGSDGKQYGPISEADIRKWISEHRLNEHTQAKAESDAEWRPLSAFPEFADAFGIPAATPGVPPPFSAAAPFVEGDYELDIGGFTIWRSTAARKKMACALVSRSSDFFSL